MLPAQKIAEKGGAAKRVRPDAWHRVGPFGDVHMKFKHILGLLCAASISVVLAGHASAQDKTVKIGAVFPLSGNAASAGIHAKAAIEVAMDIINNAHPELGNFPLAKNAGLAGLGGAKVERGLRRQPGQPRHRTEPDAAADHRREGGGAHRRLSVRHHADGERDRREIRHSLRQRRVRSPPTSPSAASNGSSASRRSPRTSPRSITTSCRT